ncbi:MAG TPA: CHAD domain-containing protein [Thermoanaerobaculia bacterium]|nr:CHAD domain-containing protein [Thermoanaerobaculia bacterium]
MPVPLLSRPPEEGVRLLGLKFLDQAAAAQLRLDAADANDANDANAAADAADAADDPEGGEALHDFRVALRRLRSCLDAYAEVLADSLSKKLRKRLRRLAAATGGGRDAEVQIEWLRREAPPTAAAQRPGYAWLLARLAKRKREAYAALQEEVREDFSRLAADLRGRLSVYKTEVHLERDFPRRTLGTVAAAVLREQVANLAEHLARIETADDERQAHRARIRAKRLRYLLEPFRGEVPGEAGRELTKVVERLKELQDLLGELHDAHVLEGELREALGRAAVEQVEKLFDLTLQGSADPRLTSALRRRRAEPGLLAVANQNRRRRDRLFAELSSGWLEGRAAGLLERAAGLAASLTGPTGPTGETGLTKEERGSG